MKIPLDDLTKADFETGSRLLKKAARRGEISPDDCAYMATSILALLMKNPVLSSTTRQRLDEVIGILMGFEEHEPA